jgi:hypothetical protein
MTLRRIAVVASTAVLCALAGASCLVAGEPCCEDDLECAAGARCFEGRCAPRCDELTPCDDGLACVEEAGVCARPQRDQELEACPYQEPSR